MDIDTAIQKAKNPATSAEELISLIGIGREGTNRILALHPNANEQLLMELAEWSDEETLINVIQNPNITPVIVRKIGASFPAALLKNPSLELLLKDDINLLDGIPSILEMAQCPDFYMEWASKHGTLLQKLFVLRNPNITKDVHDGVTAENLIQNANNQLRQLANLQLDPKFTKCVEVFAQKSSPYCMPKFLQFDKYDPAHRLQDQIINGFPFTSASHPWPLNKQGFHMQPLAQIDLREASSRLEVNLGEGLLQVWAPYIDCVDDLSIRLIEREELSSLMDEFYPNDAVWLEDPDSCIFKLHNLDLPSSRIEWLDFGQMFYPDLWRLISDNKVSVYIEDPDEYELEDLESQLDSMDIPTASFHWFKDNIPALYLGGYPLDIGNGWDCFHKENKKMLLNLTSVSGWPLFHLGVMFSNDTHGKVSFECDVSVTR